jgi:hypothetical protein
MALAWNTTDLPLHTSMFSRRNLSRSGGTTITGVEQVVQSISDFWEATISFKVRTAKQILAYRALQAQSSGRATQWIVPACPAPLFPDGVPAGVEISFDDSYGDDFPNGVSGAAASSAAFGARTINITLSPAGVVALPGMFFSIGNRLYVIATATSLGGGTYQVTFAPSLRAGVSAGTAVEFSHPTCLMRLAQDNIGQMSLELFRFADISLSFFEVPI